MEWTEKAIMVQALNQGDYKMAVDILKRNESTLDNQAMSMFANGFALYKHQLLNPIAHIIRKYEDKSVGDFRADLRIGAMLELLNK